MTDISNTLPPAVSTPGMLGQATAIEQSRAVAEVAGAIKVAQEVPRLIDPCRTMLKESCQMPRLAERAFYRYNRGDGVVTGPTIHLAREIARCWGNIQYGLAELRRDDANGLSEMMAFAWDVQTNTRASTTFIVPHERDAGGKRQPLRSLRDVYENNANMGSRRMRQQIYAVLPSWFTEEGEDICRGVLLGEDGKEKTPEQRAKDLADRVERAIAAFDAMGVSRDRLEQKLQRKPERWTVYDIAQLMITHRSLLRQEVSIDEEFPFPRVTANEIVAQAQLPAGNGTGSAPPIEVPATDPAPRAYDDDDPERPFT